MLKAARVLVFGLIAMILTAACDESRPQVVDPETLANPSVTLMWKTEPGTIIPPKDRNSQSSTMPNFDDDTRPAIDNERLYPLKVHPGTPSLFAVDQLSGNVIWQFKPQVFLSRYVSSPVHAEGLVLFAVSEVLEWTRDWNTDVLRGVLFAVDAKTGEERWRYTTGSQFTAAVVDKGVAYVGAWDVKLEGTNLISTTGFLHALDLSTGVLQWTLSYEGVRILEAPTLMDGTLYFVTEAAEASSELEPPVIRAVDLSTQRETWSVGLKSGKWISYPPIAHDGVVYLHSRGGKTPVRKGKDSTGKYRVDGDNIIAYDSATGQEIWSYGVGPPLDSSLIYTSGDSRTPGIDTAPVVIDNTIYFAMYADLSGDKYGQGPNTERYIMALDTRTGHEKWHPKS